jgi:uncharacterized protein YndB with AHSA1/START domain
MPEMTHSGAATVTLPSDTEILITREFSAPPNLVFKAWTTPELVKRYWAGKRGEMKTVEIDLREGGRYRYVMATGAGFDIAFSGEYHEIVPDERLVFTESYDEGPGADPDGEPTRNVATFTALDGGRTRLELLTECPSKEVRDAIVQSGMEDGAQEQLDALDELAQSLAD